MNINNLDKLREEYRRAAALVDSGDYQQAETMLLSIIASFESNYVSDISADVELRSLYCDMLLDLADLHARLQKYEDSRTRAELAMTLACGPKHDEQRARSCHILAKQYLFQKKFTSSWPYFEQAIELARVVGNQRLTANILSNMGLFHLEHGDYEKALDYYSESLPLHEQTNNRLSLAITSIQLGLIYDELLQHEKSLEYNLRAMKIFEDFGFMEDVGGALNNIGFNYANLGNYAKSREFYLRSIDLHEKHSHVEGSPYPYTNLGDLLRLMGHYEESLERLNAGLALTRAVGDRLQEARTLAYLSRLFATEDFALADLEQSRQYTLEALAIFEQMGATDPRTKAEIVKQHYQLAELYKRQGNYEAALHHFTEYHNLDKEVRSEGVLAKTAKFEERIVIAAERANADATKRLLHKTLPRLIADRVIRGEEHIADHFENASILFADIVGFTKISASLPPSIVLGFMNFLFEHFDTIAEAHQCERIKTMGDGYMAVCGVPLHQSNHAERVALMAIEMMKDVYLPEHIRAHLPEGTVLHLRIGLHSGQVTAGLIGTGKLAYDVYGDAVNTAARMESHGEAGKIHVSEEFVSALSRQYAVQHTTPHSTLHPTPPQPSPEVEGATSKADSTSEKALPSGEGLGGVPTHTSFHFIPRGDIEIKGKGLMRTYFLEKAH